MSELAKGEKAKPSDAELKAELSHLESMAVKREAHLAEMRARIAELKSKLGVK
jgi:hypothetical protein